MKDDLERLKQLLSPPVDDDLSHCTDEDFAMHEIARRASAAFAEEFERIRRQSKARQRRNRD